MRIENILIQAVTDAVKELYGNDLTPEKVSLQKTRKEFSGDFTVVTFPLTSISKKNPEETSKDLGNFLAVNVADIIEFNVIKGFLNLKLSDDCWKRFFAESCTDLAYGFSAGTDSNPVVLEYSSPNTNKPLHLGHIRNNLLGSSLAKILLANGKQVKEVNLVNDRGIHICKSMLAWKKWGSNETPESSGLKGDHLVGKYYVMFDKVYKQEIESLVSTGVSREEAEKTAPLLAEAQVMLQQWEVGDIAVKELWKMMNDWVYQGFDTTYKRLGISFDKTYYESRTYLLGKELVKEGLEKGVLLRKDDGSVWCDLQDEGLEEKLLLRADGTSVYITQDLGTAQLRYKDYFPERLIYVVGNEQNYHFDILKLILKKLGKPWYEKIHHYSYGMVELPEGKMKSREGTVVDADDLLDEMYLVAKQTTEELGKQDDFNTPESEDLFWMLALGALKYYILKVDPKKNILFNPQESIDFNGNTGPFIQYTHARIRSLVRKAGDFYGQSEKLVLKDLSLDEKETALLRLLYDYPTVIHEAGVLLSPALIANYLYELAKYYNNFYQTTPVLKAEQEAVVLFRLHLSAFVGRVIKSGMGLLGIDVPEKM